MLPAVIPLAQIDSHSHWRCLLCWWYNLRQWCQWIWWGHDSHCVCCLLCLLVVEWWVLYACQIVELSWSTWYECWISYSCNLLIDTGLLSVATTWKCLLVDIINIQCLASNASFNLLVLVHLLHLLAGCWHLCWVSETLTYLSVCPTTQPFVLHRVL
jgi:hypothetical protein